MKHTFKLTLKREVFFLSLAYALVFSLVFVMIIGTLLFRSKLSEMKEKLHGSNLQTVTYLNTLFDSSESLLTLVDDSIDLLNTNPLAEAAVLSTFREIDRCLPNVRSIFLGRADGSVLINDHEIPDGYDATECPWYQAAAEAYPETIVALPFQETFSDEWLFCTARALTDASGKIAAVLAVDYSINSLYSNDMLRSHYETQVDFLLNENGVCLYHPLKIIIGTNFADALDGDPDMFDDDEGYIEYTLNGESQIGYFHRLSGSQNIIVSSVDRSDVMLPALNGVIYTMLGLLLLSLLTAAAFTATFNHRYVLPVKSLKERLAALLAGKTVADTKSAYPNKEFLEIAGSMEALTKKILSQKAEELNAILESSSDGILVLDRGDRILHYNAQFLALWGLNPDKKYQQFSDLELERRLIEDHACGHPAKQIRETELCYLKSGIILERYTQVLAEREHIDGILCVFRDVTQKVKKEEQLKEIANTDFLTGLNNRRYFTFMAALEFHKAVETGDKLALLLIDIDHFKKINDTYGHDVGDRVLKAFAMHLRQCSRRSDVLGRYGGEEFCVLLPQTDDETAYQIADRVRRHYESITVDHKGEKIVWTISVGVANLTEKISTVETLIKHADVACYDAKQSGRNCVRTYRNKEENAGEDNA